MQINHTEADPDCVDRLFETISGGSGPGACVGIAIGGRPFYRKGFGLADINTPIVLTPSTRMRVGSITKQFTCLGVMLLCEQGLAALDDPAGKFLPDLPSPARGATLRQLMTHSSGVRDTHDIAWQFGSWTGELGHDELFATNARLAGYNAPAGTTWIYNNGAYLILSRVIESITKTPFAEYLAEAVFTPLGMFDTLIRPSDEGFLPRSAALHMTPDQSMFDTRRLEPMVRKRAFERGRTGISWSGEAGLVSTVNDILRWMHHMDDPVLGSRGTWREMLTPHRLANGSCSGYAFGMFDGVHRGHRILYHSGGVSGGNAHLVKVPAAHLDIIVISNRQDFYSVLAANRILDLLLPMPDDQAPCVIGFKPGIYRSPHTDRAIELSGGGAEPTATIDGFDIPMAWRPDGSLAPTGIFAHLRQFIRPADKGDTTAIDFSDFGNDDRLIRTPFLEAPINPLGTYEASDLAVTATIGEASGRLEMTTRGQFGTARFHLEHLTDVLWRARGAMPGFSWTGGILTFEMDGSGFGYASARTRNARFELRT